MFETLNCGVHIAQAGDNHIQR